MEAVIYARLSMDRTGEGVKVADQEAACRKLAASLGLTITRVYADNDLSATTGVRRPGFEQMLKDRPAVVVCWHQDRLLRVSRDLERVLDTGCTVHMVTAGTLDLSTPTGRAVARTVTAWSTYEGEHKAERQRASNRQRALRGDKWWSHRPFGYEPDTTVREDEARWLRKAYADVLAGVSAYGIAVEWNANRVQQPESPNHWQGRRITLLLKNPRNAGLSTYHGEVVGRAKWEPIVDEGTFYAVQAILSAPERRKGGAPKYSLLSGVLICGECNSGTHMARWKGQAHGYAFDRYRCNRCHFMVDAKTSEEAIKADLFEFLLNADAEAEDEPAPVDDGEVRRLEGKLDELADAYARDALTLPQLEAGTKAVQARIDSLRAQQVARATRKAHTVTYPELVAQWDASSTDQRRQWISDLGYVVATRGAKRGQKVLTWAGPTPQVHKVA